MSTVPSDEELARYHIQRAKELWGQIPEHEPKAAKAYDTALLSVSIDFHFKASHIHAVLATLEPHKKFERDEIEHQTTRAEQAESALGLILNFGFHSYIPGPLELLQLERGMVCIATKNGMRCGALAEHPVHIRLMTEAERNAFFETKFPRVH